VTAQGPRWAGPFAELLTWRTYTNALYLLLALPLGVVYTTALTAGFVVGLVLVVTLVGVPILLATVGLVSGFAAFERAQARALVGLELPDAPTPRDGSPWVWAQGYVVRAVFWKSLTYLFFKLPWGVVAFTVTVLLGAVGLALLAAPLYLTSLPLSLGAPELELSLPQVLSLSVAGLGVCMVAARVVNLMAQTSARAARFMLGDDLEEAQTQRLRVEALTLASGAANLVSSLGDPDSRAQTLERLMASVCQASAADGCALVVASGSARRVVAAHGFPSAELGVALAQAPSEGGVTKLANRKGAALATVPLEAHGRRFGELIALYSASQTPDRGELSFLRAVADQASLGLENARLIAAVRDGAALEERHRLARELHDSVSQALYGIALGARTAKAQLARDPQKVAEPLDYVLQLAEAGLTEMRALIFELRPEALETEGLVAALRKQAESVRVRHKLEVETCLGEEPQVGLEVKQALLRIAQEALHNTVKHAKAKRATVRLEATPPALTLEVADDGAGFDVSASFEGHLGQRSMRERAEAIGADYTLETAPGAGTRIRVRLPYKAG